MPRKPKRNDEAVKVDAEIVRIARILAAAKGIPLAELLSETLRAPLKKLFDEQQRKGFDLK